MAKELDVRDGPRIGGRQDALRQSECTIIGTELYLLCLDEAHRYQVSSINELVE